MKLEMTQCKSLGAVLGLTLILVACGGDNLPDSVSGVSGPVVNEPTSTEGFGVSGILFENNLVMWFRENDGRRSELFPQMYFTRSDAEDFPVWGTFPMNFVISGVVSRDGIPALVYPRFVSPSSPEASYLLDSDIVLGAVINGHAKAYPQNILWWHEIANDAVGGEDVMMTLCPLTGTGLFFRKPANGNTIDKLELLPIVETTWAKWRELYPQTMVISGNTGFDRDYTNYPYGRYRDENTGPLFPLLSRGRNTRFPAKHTVLGLLVKEVQKAYPFSRLQGKPVINDQVNGKDVLIVSDLSAKLVIPYERMVGGQLLSFELDNEVPLQMTDKETGSLWNIKGEAISGSLAGTKLSQIPAYNAFWFAWSIFWPETEVYGD